MRVVFWLLFAVAAVWALIAAATRQFQHRIDGEARALLAAAGGSAAVVEARDLEKLPPPVRRWLEVSGTVGRPRATTVRLEQRGEMRTGPDKPWMPVAAEQYFSVDPPGFVWSVNAQDDGRAADRRPRSLRGRPRAHADQGRFVVHRRRRRRSRDRSGSHAPLSGRDRLVPVGGAERHASRGKRSTNAARARRCGTRASPRPPSSPSTSAVGSRA